MLSIHDRVITQTGLPGVLTEIADGLCVVRLDSGAEIVDTFESVTLDDMLGIPSFLDCRRPEVRAEHEAARAMPFTSAPIKFQLEVPSNADAATQAFLEAERQREEAEKQNSLAAFKAKKETKVLIALGARWVDGRWITPEQSFAIGAERAKVTVDELRAAFEAVAASPAKEGLAVYARRILAGIDNGKLALEHEKALERAKRKAKRIAERQSFAPLRRRRAA